MMIMSSGALLTRGAAGDADYSTFGLNGTNEYMTIADSSSIDVGTGDATFHIVAAINNNGSTQMIFSKGAGGYPNYDFYIDSSGVIYCRLELNASNHYNYTTDGVVDYSDGVFRSFIWDTNRAANQPILYVNGVSVTMVLAASSGTVATGDISSAGALNIGRRDLGGSNLYANGAITEFFKFNKSLSASEALNLHNSGIRPYYTSLPTNYTDYGDIALELSGRDSTGNDLTPNGNNATFVNGISDDGLTQTFASYS